MKFSQTIAVLFLVFVTYWTFDSLTPTYDETEKKSLTEFSTTRALRHVKEMSKKPHAVGFPAHDEVKEYVSAELVKLGLEVETQEGFSIREDWGNLCYVQNVVAKIPGSKSGKALLLLSHYDSNTHSSLGASDAASGVATILEATRAFLENNQTPENDIIILFTDAEEIGLNGAEKFVNEHPWAEDVGLILNFEARGSGGPSIMLVETNRGNQHLINEFAKANSDYPVGNSLAYSIYKLLPNDTDLTSFRENLDVDGFNFAFIDDHYDYHTALDNYDRLDRNSLAHQGNYLVPLLNHFANTDLSTVKSLNDNVYFTVPLFKMVTYPFDWIWPMYIVALLAFILLLWHGFKSKKLDLRSTLVGFTPLLLTLVISGVFGYILWPFLKWWYPWFDDVLHGFVYWGKYYIIIVCFFSITTCILIYREFRKIEVQNLLIAPIIFWLLICLAINIYLKGAAFFIIPLYGLLATLLVTINQKKPEPLLLAFLAAPAIAIFAPFTTLFPIGLGLKLLVSSALLSCIIFYFSLTVFQQFKYKLTLALICLGVFIFYNVRTHVWIRWGFTTDAPKPTSLVYLLDADKNKAQWATYDKIYTDWNMGYLENSTDISKDTIGEIISSKYNTRLKAVAPAPLKTLPQPNIVKELDTISNGNRKLQFCIKPERPVNRLDIYKNNIPLKSLKINGISLSNFYLEKKEENGRLITHYISENNYTELELEIDAKDKLELKIYESSNDLLEHKMFTVPPRPDNEIPMPFVLNDAVIITKTITLD